MNNIDYIKSINDCSEAFRTLLVRNCCDHATAQCNGEYWQNDDGTWSDKAGDAKETSIVKRLVMALGLPPKNPLPDFITYNGDPRGFTVYMKEDQMTEAEKELAKSLGFQCDWGNNFWLLKNGEDFHTTKGYKND